MYTCIYTYIHIYTHKYTNIYILPKKISIPIVNVDRMNKKPKTKPKPKKHQLATCNIINLIPPTKG
jgi:hypothetical protein